MPWSWCKHGRLLHRMMPTGRQSNWGHGLSTPQVLAERYLPELEALKPRVLLGRLAAPPAAARHAPGAVRLTTSDLPEIRGDQWGLPGGVPAAPSAPPLPPGEAGFGPQPGVPGGGTDFGINGTAYGAPAVAASDWDLLEGGVPAARAPVAPVPPPAPPNGLPVNDLMRRLEVSVVSWRGLAHERACARSLCLTRHSCQSIFGAAECLQQPAAAGGQRIGALAACSRAMPGVTEVP